MDILISEELVARNTQWLLEKYDVVCNGALWKDPAALKSAIGSARALMVRNQTQVTAELLAAAPKLIGVGRLGVGLDNIDVPAASELGVVVIAPLDANATSVAELAMGFMLALARKIPQADRSTKAGNWDRKGCNGIELDGKTLAICGFGRIGRLVAARARSFGLRLLVFDPYVKADSPLLRECGAALCSRLEEAVAGADFVTAHLPLTTETRNIFNAQICAAMKPGSFFINTSRGGVVDEKALLEALRSGHLGGAALDVREIEPPSTRDSFETMDNVILAPHIGAATTEAQTRTFEAVAGDIDRLLSGEAAVNFVNFDRPRR
jgi:D-3-phosphoglycerate dehydrogenase